MTGARLPGFLLLAALAFIPSDAVQAHTGARAFIQLLPTHLYIAGGALNIVGGALTVALSFAVMALVPVAGRWMIGG